MKIGFGKADWQIYTTYSVVETAERLAESRNDNLGKDLARYLGQVVVGGIPGTSGARWDLGEKFADSSAKVSLLVKSATPRGFLVEVIGAESAPPPGDPRASLIHRRVVPFLARD